MSEFEKFLEETSTAPPGARVFFDMYPICGFGYIRGIKPYFIYR